MSASASEPASEPWGKTVKVEFEDGIAWVVLNRPEKRNAMSPELAHEMFATVDALEIDDRCGVLVLTGAGEAFSAGMDLREYFRANDNKSAVDQARLRRVNASWQWRRLMYYPKPTIAMVNGWCFGGAFTPLVSCDLSIAAEEATFGLSEINWGIIPGGVVTRAVAAKMNQADALYDIMTGETFDGKKAAQMGLVNEAVPLAKLRERTRALAQVLLKKNPTVLRTAKNAYRHVKSMDWEASEDYLMAKNVESTATDPEKGRQKGMSQFLDEKSYRPGLQTYRRDE
ncbi:MAG: p-hydroxycinnamoyl CoA hydratase/lyase [Hyphomicrobiales bacterium]|nr:p-hydroxycinnamoyl CoA hydratase/lyase [Hyphomicrobiales bacterium]